MKHRVSVSFSLLAVTAGWLSADTAPAPGDLARARTLVQQLASEDFAAREQATQELRKFDKAVEVVLREGIASSDVEVQRRCGELLERCQRTDLERALDAYLEKHDDRVFDQPWPRFAKVLGDTPEARKLFQEMCLAEGALLASLDHSPPAAAEMFACRCQALCNRGFAPQGALDPITLPQACALLYVANDQRLGAGTSPLLIYNFLHRQEVRTALPGHPVARRLVVTFIEHRSEPTFLYQNLNLVHAYGLKECGPWVVKMVQDKTQQPQTRGQALMALARMGGKEHIPALEALLTDATSLGQLQYQNGRVETQLRDVALAALVILHGQSLEPYEFPFLKQNPHLLKQDPATFQIPAVWLGFANDDARAVALKKYRDSLAALKKD